MDIQSANRQLAQGQDLSRDEMQSVIRIIMGGDATPAQIGAFLTALMIKGETVDEILGAATIMSELSEKVVINADKIVDTVGTGGDGAKLFNVSTASAFVAAAAGATMAKHGNRAATGNSGSADVLEAAGVNITISPEQVARCIETCGVGFMFAPTHHSAIRHVIGPRKEIGIRTVFNLLGPLTNPAGATHQLVGVFAKQWVKPLAEVYAGMGSEHTVVVSSDDGLDEISIAAGTEAAEYRNGHVTTYRIEPEDFGITRTPLDSLIVSDSQQSLSIIQSALSGTAGPAYDMLAMNAGATIYAADLADSLSDGVNAARDILDSGAALKKMDQMVEFTSQFQS